MDFLRVLDYLMLLAFGASGIVLIGVGLILIFDGASRLYRVYRVLGVGFGLTSSAISAFATAIWWHGVIKGLGVVVTLSEPYLQRFVLTAFIIWAVQVVLGVLFWRVISRPVSIDLSDV